MSYLNRIKRMTTDATTHEEAVANVVATAYNHLDAKLLKPVLADDCKYTSVDNENVISGADKVISLLDSEFEFMRENNLQYTANIAGGDNLDPVIVLGDEGMKNPPLLLLTFADNKLVSIHRRYNTMLSLKDLYNSHTLQMVLGQAVYIFNKWLPTMVAKENLSTDTFTILQKHPIKDAPASQHLSFSIGNDIYSVVIKFSGQYHTPEEGKIVALDNIDTEKRLDECKHRGFTPCEIVFDVNLLSTPKLYYENTTEQVNIKQNK